MMRNAIIKSLSSLRFFQHYTSSNKLLNYKQFRTMTSFKPVDHVIFDLDGLLLDTEVFYHQVAIAVCSSYGKEFTPQLRVSTMGLPGPQNAKLVIDTLSLPVTPEEYRAQMHSMLRDKFPTAKLMPGTEDLYVEIFQTIASRYGKVYTKEVREKVMGKTEEEAGLGIIEGLDLPLTLDQFLDLQFKLHHTFLPRAQLLPGAERLIRHLHSRGIPIAVATSSAKDSVDLKLTNHKELFSLFDHFVMASSDPEVKRGKPSPDIFLVCASRFASKPAPDKCLVFEDAPNGVKAAVAAGMQVIMVPDEIVQEENKKEATLVLRSLEYFQPELFGLPPFEKCSC